MLGYSSHSKNTFQSKVSRGTASPRISSGSFAVTSVAIPQALSALDEDEDDSDADPTNNPLEESSSNNHSEAPTAPSLWHSSQNNSNGTSKNRRSSSSKMKLAIRETQQICWLRGITIVIFMLAAALVSLAIFHSSANSQQDLFEQVYQEQAQQVLHTLSSRLTQMLQGMDQWAIQYQGDTIPDSYTLDNYETKASSMVQLAQVEWLGMAPLISNKTAWEGYTQDSWKAWISYDGGGAAAAAIWTQDEEIRSWTTIHPEPLNAANDQNIDYLPLWQHYPFQSDWVNQDLLQTSGTKLEATLSILNAPPTIVLGQFTKLTGDDLEQEDEKSNDVASLVYFPIVNNNDNDIDNDNALGLVLGYMNWLDYLKAPLDATANGMIGILNNQCNGAESFAFQVVVPKNDEESSYFQVLDTLPNLNTLLQDQEEILDIAEVLQNVAENDLSSSSSSSSNSILFQADYCPYTFHVYPTEEVREHYFSRQPAIFTGAIVGAFIFCSIVFLIYDCLVERRQRVVMKSAAKTHDIVAGLFPEVIRDRLFGDSNHSNTKKKKNYWGTTNTNSGNNKSNSNSDDDSFVQPRMVNFLGHEAHNLNPKSRPMADLFPHTTVLFADIAGFTAWSSVRDPSQVFTLLETLYAAFDKLALRRRVFKVETIGDCYVAVTGLPTPQKDHACIMVKFAKDVLMTMQQLGQSLEVELGPDTGDLALRIGMHSGPVTAGVLRGQKSRFQLFGDTVNTAARMESNGYANQIQCSQQTADNLTKANKGHWIHPRKDLVHAKGKGLVQTYWVLASKAFSSQASRHSAGEDDKDDDESDITEEPLNDIALPPPPLSSSALRRSRSEVSPHLQRLITWNVDMLAKVIKTIVATRQSRMPQKFKEGRDSRVGVSFVSSMLPNFGNGEGRGSFFSTTTGKAVQTHASSDDSMKTPALLVSSNPREEYTQTIRLPHFDPYKKVARRQSGYVEVELDAKVLEQLRDFVMTIACAYNDNPFHNFEHASHVTMSANKILKRVVNADHVQVRKASMGNLASKMHDYTYGITSDPMTHFACLFSAMIHDVDHPGVSNAQLLKEKSHLADVYDGKSIAEQNSFDFAWELLMDGEYEVLRRCIFEDQAELKRFRQLVINSIMATDIFDPELVKLRNDRWLKAFPPEGELTDEVKDGESIVSNEEMMDLKATIVIEHIIQAADVAHTMQHWHVYQKWNRRLFDEMHAAFKAERSASDPANSWYKGELWFYDNYIIPLAKKLEECQVFGISSDEFLTYALDNRSEWETKGQAIVDDMLENCTNQSEEFLLIQMSKGDIALSS